MSVEVVWKQNGWSPKVHDPHGRVNDLFWRTKCGLTIQESRRVIDPVSLKTVRRDVVEHGFPIRLDFLDLSKVVWCRRCYRLPS